MKNEAVGKNISDLQRAIAPEYKPSSVSDYWSLNAPAMSENDWDEFHNLFYSVKTHELIVETCCYTMVRHC